MKQLYYTTKRAKSKHISLVERQKIETLFKEGYSCAQIAEHIGCCKRTIEREKSRGKVLVAKTVYDEYAVALHQTEREKIYYESYAAEVAEAKSIINSTAKGRHIKLGKNYEFAEYIRKKIVNDKYSPYAALAEAKLHKKEYANLVCTKTLYNYIANGYIPGITQNNLHMRGKTPIRAYNKVRVAYNNTKGRSIEERPVKISERKEYGHWELDSVVGKGKSALVVFTEMKSRQEIIVKVPSKSQDCVKKVLDKIERELGAVKFREKFKTITVDNGSEFLSQSKLENSCINKKKKRTTIYYCHPYSAYERGSNENANKLIRRKIPKGSDISKYSNKEIKELEDWINNYPRQILGGYPPRMIA